MSSKTPADFAPAMSKDSDSIAQSTTEPSSPSPKRFRSAVPLTELEASRHKSACDTILVPPTEASLVDPLRAPAAPLSHDERPNDWSSQARQEGGGYPPHAFHGPNPPSVPYHGNDGLYPPQRGTMTHFGSGGGYHNDAFRGDPRGGYESFYPRPEGFADMLQFYPHPSSVAPALGTQQYYPRQPSVGPSGTQQFRHRQPSIGPSGTQQFHHRQLSIGPSSDTQQFHSRQPSIGASDAQRFYPHQPN